MDETSDAVIPAGKPTKTLQDEVLPALSARKVAQGALSLTEVRSAGGGDLLAVFTQGAHTVGLRGPRRVFTDSASPSRVAHRTWVRALPKPFAGTLDAAWLLAALGANAAGLPDVLALAMQYLHGAREIHEGGLRVAGEAHYGPLVDGKRDEGSDFNDYLGIPWRYGSSEGAPDDPPEPEQAGCLDCSGYMRMVWGYRSHAPAGTGLPLCYKEPREGAIPRRSHEMFRRGPGCVVIERTRSQPSSFDRLQVGDLVFFDADLSAADSDRLDHVGMFLGIDAAGRYRFVSSRKTHDGPTFGDAGGPSLLDGDRLYARRFRAARRF